MAIYVRNEQGNLKPLEIPALQGKDGLTPDIQIGEVTKLESDALPTVTRRGTKEEPIFDFGIPHVGIEDRDKLDYMGNPHETLKETNDANVEYVLGEVNTVHYEGQHITAKDTFEKQVKSAILKGQTLVNLIEKENDKVISNYESGNILLTSYQNIQLKASTKYTFIFKASNVSSANKNGMYQYQGSTTGNTFYKYNIGTHTMINGLNYLVFTPPVDIKQINFLSYGTFLSGGGCTIHGGSFILLEGDYTNVDIPYFEGMQSVKMPVLTTTGNNLWDDNWSKGLTQTSGNVLTGGTYDGFRYNNNLISVDGISTIYLKHFCPQEGVPQSFRVGQYGKDKEWLNKPLTIVNDGIFNVPSDCKYIRVHVELRYNGTSNNTSDSIPTMMVVSTSKITGYEPYKTNILSCNEEVVLRRIKETSYDTTEIRDELDLVNGIYTKKLTEVKITDDMLYVVSENDEMIVFGLKWYKLPDIKVEGNVGNGTKVLCNLLQHIYVGGKQGIFAHGMRSEFQLTISKTSSISTEAQIRQWFKDNDLTIIYQLKNPIIKTVDLSDNHVYSYKDTTHYTCSSENDSLVPTLSIDVPTNLSALVSNQRMIIEKQKEEINTLEATNEELISKNEEQDEIIDITLMATDEMYLMLEPLLVQVMTTQGGDSKMVDMYVAMIQRGLKTIDQVPARYREQVQEILAQLEA